MLSIGDCVGMCGLDEDELRVLAEHEHLPMIVAAELAANMLQTPGGIRQIRHFVLEALEASVARHDWEREKHLRTVLGHFTSAHPVRPVL